MMGKWECMEPSEPEQWEQMHSKTGDQRDCDSVWHINHSAEPCECSVKNNARNCEFLPWGVAWEEKWFTQAKRIPWWNCLRMPRDFWLLSFFGRMQCIFSWWERENYGAYFKVFRRVWSTNKGSIPLQKCTWISRELFLVEGINIENLKTAQGGVKRNVSKCRFRAIFVYFINYWPKFANDTEMRKDDKVNTGEQNK